MSGETPHRVFRFGIFEANERTGELRKAGIRLKLHSQPFQVLLMLLERPAEIVARQEMRERLWGKETFVDFDHGLNTAVNRIREALTDSASTPRYVETVPGKGYRFVAPVTAQLLGDTAEKGEAAAVAVAMPETPEKTPGAFDRIAETMLTTPEELPVIPRKTVRILLVLIQVMYLAFYVSALANLGEVHEIFLEAAVADPGALLTLVIATGTALIPIRLFLIVAVVLAFRNLPAKFAKLFPLLLVLDLLWAVSPFLLIHHVDIGVALALCAPLVYVPFAQRSLVLMYGSST
ncbi:MAG: winged helix-turn-helix domain-containing protein [Bryobacteraceae bacterium]